MGGPLQIRLLGRFEVARDGEPIPASAWRRRRPADLLALLALTPGRRLQRQEVFDALWPGKDEASAANNLHRALHDLRRVIAGRDVDLTPGGVTLRHDAWVDAEAFEAAVRAGGPDRLQEAVALYRGDLLVGAPDAPWLAPHRRRLRALFAEASERTGTGPPGPGPDPDPDDGRLTGLLASRAALRLLGTTRLPPLRGREAFVASLERLLDAGHGACILLGEAGIGTTRLALEGAILAEARAFHVVAVTGAPGGGPPGALFAELPGRGRPCYLLLDDLHLVDAASLDLLVPLLRDAARRGLVVVATCRDDAVHAGTPLQAALAALEAGHLASGLHLPRLPLAGTRQQVTDLLGTCPAEPLALAIHRASDGLPARTAAEVAAWRETGRLPGEGA